MTKTELDIRPLKIPSTDLLPPESMLRRVLACEPDFIAAIDYVSKLGTWLTILREETKA